MIENLKNSANSKTVGGIVRNTILHHIMRHGNFTIPQISDSTGYSLTTISKYVSEMIDEGLVSELEPVAANGKGRRAILYSISSNVFYFIGVDIRSFDLNIGVMNFVGEMLKIEHRKDFKFENDHNTFELVCNSIQDFMNGLEEDGITSSHIMGITFNLTGRVNTERGTSASVFNFEELKDTPLSETLSDRFKKPVFIINDTKAMTYGEYMHIDNTCYKNMIFVNAGWGLGIGIIIDGKLYYGKDGYSGEFGHIPVYENNILCHCGKKGCIETEVSGSAISRKLMNRINNGEVSILSDIVSKNKSITTKEIIQAIESEDPLAIDVINQTGNELGRHLAGLINILNPEIIVIGGSLSRIATYYFHQQIELSVRKFSLRLMSQNVQIVSSKLGSDVGVIGACMISRNRLFGF